MSVVHVLVTISGHGTSSIGFTNLVLLSVNAVLVVDLVLQVIILLSELKVRLL